MVLFTNMTHSPCNWTGHIIFEITIEGLMFAIVNFKICKVSSAVLRGKRTFLHINVMFLFLFRINICWSTWSHTSWTYIIAVLIIERSIWYIIRNFAHAFWIDWHWFMCFLSHSEHLAHLRRSWSSTTYSAHVALLDQPILLSHVLKIRMLQCLPST